MIIVAKLVLCDIERDQLFPPPVQRLQSVDVARTTIIALGHICGVNTIVSTFEASQPLTCPRKISTTLIVWTCLDHRLSGRIDNLSCLPPVGASLGSWTLLAFWTSLGSCASCWPSLGSCPLSTGSLRLWLDWLLAALQSGCRPRFYKRRWPRSDFCDAAVGAKLVDVFFKVYLDPHMVSEGNRSRFACRVFARFRGTVHLISGRALVVNIRIRIVIIIPAVGSAATTPHSPPFSGFREGLQGCQSQDGPQHSFKNKLGS